MHAISTWVGFPTNTVRSAHSRFSRTGRTPATTSSVLRSFRLRAVPTDSPTGGLRSRRLRSLTRHTLSKISVLCCVLLRFLRGSLLSSKVPLQRHHRQTRHASATATGSRCSARHTVTAILFRFLYDTVMHSLFTCFIMCGTCRCPSYIWKLHSHSRGAAPLRHLRVGLAMLNLNELLCPLAFVRSVLWKVLLRHLLR
jgi:hypothetical protein